MKNLKIFGIIILIAVMAFAFTACPTESDGGGGGPDPILGVHMTGIIEGIEVSYEEGGDYVPYTGGIPEIDAAIQAIIGNDGDEFDLKIYRDTVKKAARSAFIPGVGDNARVTLTDSKTGTVLPYNGKITYIDGEIVLIEIDLGGGETAEMGFPLKDYSSFSGKSSIDGWKFKYKVELFTTRLDVLDDEEDDDPPFNPDPIETGSLEGVWSKIYEGKLVLMGGKGTEGDYIRFDYSTTGNVMLISNVEYRGYDGWKPYIDSSDNIQFWGKYIWNVLKGSDGKEYLFLDWLEGNFGLLNRYSEACKDPPEA